MLDQSIIYVEIYLSGYGVGVCTLYKYVHSGGGLFTHVDLSLTYLMIDGSFDNTVFHRRCWVEFG